MVCNASIYVEPVRPVMEPSRCRACDGPFLVGQLRAGYTPARAAPGVRAPVWVHAPCLAVLGLELHARSETVGFSPRVSAAQRRQLLEELAAPGAEEPGPPELLRALPVQRLPRDEPEPCVICCEEMRQGETVRRLPCLHLFHQACVDRWAQVKAACPLCNTALEPPR